MEQKINFGCGGNTLPGWLNVDAEVDITQPLPYADGSCEAVFAEHVVEHITQRQAWDFFAECYRILQPLGYVRIVVPSVARLAGFLSRNHADVAAYLQFSRDFGSDGTPAGAVKALAFSHGHQTVWGADTLLTLLVAAGFTRVHPTPLYESPYGCLEGHQKVIGRTFNTMESLAVEGYKP